MKPEGSFPPSQQPVTCPYPEPDEPNSTLCHPNSITYILILFSHIQLGLPCDLHSPCFPTKIPYALLLSPIRDPNLGSNLPAIIIIIIIIIRWQQNRMVRFRTYSLRSIHFAIFQVTVSKEVSPPKLYIYPLYWFITATL